MSYTVCMNVQEESSPYL